MSLSLSVYTPQSVIIPGGWICPGGGFRFSARAPRGVKNWRFSQSTPGGDSRRLPAHLGGCTFLGPCDTSPLGGMWIFCQLQGLWRQPRGSAHVFCRTSRVCGFFEPPFGSPRGVDFIFLPDFHGGEGDYYDMKSIYIYIL